MPKFMYVRYFCEMAFIKPSFQAFGICLGFYNAWHKSFWTLAFP